MPSHSIPALSIPGEGPIKVELFSPDIGVEHHQTIDPWPPPLPRAVLLRHLPKAMAPLVDSYVDACSPDYSDTGEGDWANAFKNLGVPCAGCEETCDRKCLDQSRSRIRRCSEVRGRLDARLQTLSSGSAAPAALLARAYLALGALARSRASVLVRDASSQARSREVWAYAAYVRALAQWWDGGHAPQGQILVDLERAAPQLLPEDAAFADWQVGRAWWSDGDVSAAGKWYQRELLAAPRNSEFHVFALRELMWVALAEGDQARAFSLAAQQLDQYGGAVSYDEAAWVGAVAYDLLRAERKRVPPVGRRAFAAIALELGDQAAQRRRVDDAGGWYQSVIACGHETAAWGVAFTAIYGRELPRSKSELQRWAVQMRHRASQDACPRSATVLQLLGTDKHRREQLARYNGVYAPDAALRGAVAEATDNCVSTMSHGRLDWLATGWHIRVDPRTGAAEVLAKPGPDLRFDAMATCVGSLLSRYVGGGRTIDIEVTE